MEALIDSGGNGAYRDTHPWLVAQEIFEEVSAQGQRLALLFAAQTPDKHCEFSHWAQVTGIDVVELHRGQWESRCHFGTLYPINPIWTSIDSVFVQPSDTQLARESKENVRVFRTALDEHHIHPYAVCETPVFVLESID